MKILVSGGTGFVGRFIVEDLLAAGHRVTILSRIPLPQNFFSQPVEFIHGSLNPDLDQRAAFGGIDAFVHAAFDHVPGQYRGGEGDDPDRFVRANREGSLALFRQARDAGVQRAVFLSSRAVHDLPPTLYGRVKRDVEIALAGMASPNFSAHSLRLTGVYGPAASGHTHKWADLFADYLSGWPVAPRAGTEIHGSDAAAAVRLSLDRAAEIDPTMPLEATDILVDRHDLLAIVKQQTGSPHPLPARADASRIHRLDPGRLSELGWRPGGWLLLEATVGDLITA